MAFRRSEECSSEFFLYKGKVHFGDTSEACDLADFNLVFFSFASASAYINVNSVVTEL